METLLKKIKEGKTFLLVPEYKNKKGPGEKKAGFYNPAMKMNRDVSILIVQWLVNASNKPVKILDGLAASGARGVRIANEVEGDFFVTINDWNKKAFNLIIKNTNGLDNTEAVCKNVNCLLHEKKFHYIDIDPFGTPIPYIDAAVKNVTHNGVLAVTATDTATLCGVYPKTCIRRYSAMPLHSWVKHEVGLRILIGYICRESAKYDKGIDVLLSHSTDHYMRVYIRLRKGAKEADESLKKVKKVDATDFTYENKKTMIGPLWTEKLHNKEVLKKLKVIMQGKTLGKKRNVEKLLTRAEEETDLPIFFYTTDVISSQLKVSPPKLSHVLEMLKKLGFKAGRTQFGDASFKTDATKKEVYQVFKKTTSY
ncbi:MAG TPA: tRNA (guanine(10)-N(2))-dimethyltransferase [Thermoplasmatales archaeon]|nr:tRNA (guanine(10)-N(2))-dimethyltransferase [Thermoplasmatales archaeon]